MVGTASALLLGAVVAGPTLWASVNAHGRIAGVADLPPANVALVLGAAVDADGRPSAFLRARLDLAHDLLRAGKVTRLLLSGDGRDSRADEPATMRRYLLDLGVPADRLVLDGFGFDTYESCARASALVGVGRLVVVTQTYHLPRALAICRGLGLDAVGVGDDTMRSNGQEWARGRLREVPANVKAALDVLTRRGPTLAPPQPAVPEALRSPR